MPRSNVSNTDISLMLDHIANLLQAKGENPFRIRSYRTAADEVRNASQPLAKLLTSQGSDALQGLKGIGDKLAGLIAEYVESDKVELVQELEKEVPREKLAEVQKKEARHAIATPVEISVDIILEIDSEYRKKAVEGKLKKIAPRKLNPDKTAWLPVMMKSYKGCKFTVMFSNTETAHELGKTDDWVVVYYEKGSGENQCTVVTESRGALKGKRVIRGREKECTTFYE
jgi:5'-3' exonuclease